MSEKIEINTLITKHENKYKDCRFDLIDVEDPLWEYGSPLKRVLIDNQTGETYDSVSKLVDLLNSLDDEIKESSFFIIEQRKENKRLHEENERLKNKLNVTALELVDEAISMGKAVEISEMNYKEFIDYRAENGKPMELQL